VCSLMRTRRTATPLHLTQAHPPTQAKIRRNPEPTPHNPAHLTVEDDFCPIGVKDAACSPCVAAQLVKGMQGCRHTRVPQRDTPQHKLPCSAQTQTQTDAVAAADAGTAAAAGAKPVAAAVIKPENVSWRSTASKHTDCNTRSMPYNAPTSHTFCPKPPQHTHLKD
jgi:hypothetical protein